MSRAAASLCSSNVRVGIEARSAINVHESPARTTYDDPHVRVDGAAEVLVTGAEVSVSLLTVVATLVLTLSVGSSVDTSGLELSGKDEGATEGNWLVAVDANSLSSLGAMSPDTEVTKAAWLREIAEVSSDVRRFDHATGTTRANATKMSTTRLTKGSMRNDDPRERIDATVSF